MSKHCYLSKEVEPKIEGSPYLLMMRIIVYFNRNRKIIVLTDKDEQYISITYGKKCIECGKTHAPVYPATNVGDVILEENGVIGNESDSYYILSWEYYDKEKQQWR